MIKKNKCHRIVIVHIKFCLQVRKANYCIFIFLSFAYKLFHAKWPAVKLLPEVNYSLQQNDRGLRLLFLSFGSRRISKDVTGRKSNKK